MEPPKLPRRTVNHYGSKTIEETVYDPPSGDHEQEHFDDDDYYQGGNNGNNGGPV